MLRSAATGKPLSVVSTSNSAVAWDVWLLFLTACLWFTSRRDGGRDYCAGAVAGGRVGDAAPGGAEVGAARSRRRVRLGPRVGPSTRRPAPTGRGVQQCSSQPSGCCVWTFALAASLLLAAQASRRPARCSPPCRSRAQTPSLLRNSPRQPPAGCPPPSSTPQVILCLYWASLCCWCMRLKTNIAEFFPGAARKT